MAAHSKMRTVAIRKLEGIDADTGNGNVPIMT